MRAAGPGGPGGGAPRGAAGENFLKKHVKTSFSFNKNDFFLFFSQRLGSPRKILFSGGSWESPQKIFPYEIKLNRIPLASADLHHIGRPSGPQKSEVQFSLLEIYDSHFTSFSTCSFQRASSFLKDLSFFTRICVILRAPKLIQNVEKPQQNYKTSFERFSALRAPPDTVFSTFNCKFCLLHAERQENNRRKRQRVRNSLSWGILRSVADSKKQCMFFNDIVKKKSGF